MHWYGAIAGRGIAFHVALFSIQFYRAIRGGRSDATESAEVGNGLENLQRHTLAVLQNESEALKAELKNYQVRSSLYTA